MAFGSFYMNTDEFTIIILRKLYCCHLIKNDIIIRKSIVLRIIMDGHISPLFCCKRQNCRWKLSGRNYIRQFLAISNYQIRGSTSENIPAFFSISWSLPIVQIFSDGSAICSKAAQS